MPEHRKVRILTAKEIGLIIDRMASDIVKRSSRSDSLALIGIRTRGDILARRLHERISRATGREVLLGDLDITLYRDDLDALGSKLQVGRTRIEFELRDRQVVLVDDVLYTGRTVRAALDEILDLGRPSRIALAVLIDRGHRELPITADFVGKVIATAPEDSLQVRVREVDGVDEAVLHTSARVRRFRQSDRREKKRSRK